MLGALGGDIIGSVYERNNIKRENFPLFSPACRFTDDSVLTIALADSILHQEPYVEKLKSYYQWYPGAGYGGNFHRWAKSESMDPYNSWGNGSAMRVSPVGWSFNDLDTVLLEAKKSAAVTHNHPEGIKGAQATVAAIFLARQGDSKAQIKSYIEENFAYDLTDTLENLRVHYDFDVSCQGSVPQAIIAFLNSEGYEDAVRKAISIGGDSDTIACIAGGIAEAFYGGVPEMIIEKTYTYLDDRLTSITEVFCQRYCL